MKMKKAEGMMTGAEKSNRDGGNITAKMVFAAICMILVTMTGCASHNAARQPDISFDLQAQENRTEKKGIQLMVKVFHQKSDLKTYFDEDLLQYNILPMQIGLQNKSYGKKVVFNTDGINLIDPTGSRNPVMSGEQVIAKAKKSYWRTAGWGVAFGIVGIIPSLINVSNTNDKIQADYESRMLKSGNLVAAGQTTGLVFFNVPDNISNLSGWKVSLILKDVETSEDIVLEHGISGEIVSPKERTNEQNKALEGEKTGMK